MHMCYNILYIYIYLLKFMHTCMHTCTYIIYIHIQYTYIYLYIYTHVNIFTYTYIHIHMYIDTYIPLHTYIYIYISYSQISPLASLRSHVPALTGFTCCSQWVGSGEPRRVGLRCLARIAKVMRVFLGAGEVSFAGESGFQQTIQSL